MKWWKILWSQPSEEGPDPNELSIDNAYKTRWIWYHTILEKGSKYADFDLDKDGTVSDEEIKRAQDILEIELREEKFEAQKRMAWVAMGSMVVFTLILFTPAVSEGRVSALADLLGLFYIAQTGVVGAYMGVTAWLSKR